MSKYIDCPFYNKEEERCEKGGKIDKDIFYMDKSRTRYGELESVNETPDHIITRARADGQIRHFIFEKDDKRNTQKRSFRVRSVKKLINSDWSELSYKDKILYSAEGERIGELLKEAPDYLKREIVERELK